MARAIAWLGEMRAEVRSCEEGLGVRDLLVGSGDGGEGEEVR